MKFGAIDVGDAVGAVLVHTQRAGDRVLKKGRVLDAGDVAALAASGHATVICARLVAGELAEDAAATRIAISLGGGHTRLELTHTGRTNVHAARGGVLILDRAAIDAANAIDEAVTVATLRAFEPVRDGDMVATVKIIPFGVAEAAVMRAVEIVRAAVTIAPWRGCRAGLIQTRFDDTAAKVLDRTVVTQRTRMARCGGELVDEVRVAHEAGAVAGAIARLAGAGLDPIFVLGASAIMDRRDVIPAALERAGGEVVRFGMPVDPGNLLMLGKLGERTVIGVPGCARSLKPSGFDWVLERVCAGVELTAAELAGMGVGGLLEEISVRPSPRDPTLAQTSRIAAVVLAAGRASRMGSNKLVAALDGEPVVRHTVRSVLASRARPVLVVTGHEPERVREALDGLDVEYVHNPDYADGMSTSLRAGLAAAGQVDAAMVCLGDMPRLQAGHFDALIDAYRAGHPGDIVVPTYDRKRGNPVLWPRKYFADMAELAGDVGARGLLDRNAAQIRFVAIDDVAILVDVDTPSALAALQRS
ncbi:MAG TPA: molybdopterin-binding/glycosyltransferase family 2 protein [Kofleriaceae bacterium]